MKLELLFTRLLFASFTLNCVTHIESWNANSLLGSVGLDIGHIFGTAADDTPADLRVKTTHPSTRPNNHEAAAKPKSDIKEVIPATSRLPKNEPITFQVVPNGRYETSLETWYTCPSGPSPDDRAALPTNNPFSFTTHIQTNLNILFMGDSVGVEFGKWFQIASSAKRRDALYNIKWKKNQPGDGLAAAPVSGGGIVAFWRLLGLFEERHRGRALPNKGYGWRVNWRRMLNGHAKEQPGARPDYQVLIFRISHPWVCPDEVTLEKLQETVVVARTVLGKDIKVIFMTAPMNNNVVIDNAAIPSDARCASNCELHDFQAMNNRIREFVATTNSPNVLVSDVDMYMANIISWNAQQIGLDDDDPASLMQTLVPLKENQNYFQQVAQVCSEKVREGSTSCRRNVLSNDGMHMCMETVGPRMFANWACLIQCSYKQKDERACEKDCNEKFFTLSDAAITSTSVQ